MKIGTLIALLLLAACARDPGLAPAAPVERALDSEGPPLAACELLHLFGFARAEAASEVEAVALALPCGCRDSEIAWVLTRAPAARKARLIESLDAGETARAAVVLRECARSADPDERDAALVALSRAGDADVMPLVGRALRVEVREGSLVALAGAAANLGPWRPTDALKIALARARSARACLAITEALGDELDAEAVRILGARGAVGAPALELALRLLRSPRLAQVPRPEGDAPQARPRACEASAEPVAALHLAAASAIADDTARERELTRWLACRLRRRGPGASGAAAALGALGGPDATAALAESLRDADGLLVKAVSASLATALRTSPEREPEDPIEIRRLWFPILATLVRKD